MGWFSNINICSGRSREVSRYVECKCGIVVCIDCFHLTRKMVYSKTTISFSYEGMNGIGN